VAGWNYIIGILGARWNCWKAHIPTNIHISWTEDIKKARSGDYYIKLYDEEKYVAVRKAIRNGEDPDSVNPLAVVVLNNPGIFLGPWVNSEFLAALLAILVSYSAFSAKYKLLA
ncbi:Translocon-associated protein subunit delta, partial [Trachymyrmex septentrionalis]